MEPKKSSDQQRATPQSKNEVKQGAKPVYSSLSNGLDVVVIPDHRVPVVTHMVWYRNGSADDALRASGVAHFLEHLMFKGTKKHAAGEFSALVSRLGGQENAFTSYDYTAYFQRVPKQHLATMMEFESDRMHNLSLAEDVIKSERDVVMEERRMRTDSSPSAQLSEAMAATLFTHHPYGIPIIGWMHELETLTRQDALDYYKRFYTPENAILIVAGDVTQAEVLELAKKTYGKIPSRGEKPVRIRAQEPILHTARRISLADPKVEQPMFSRNYIVPSIRTAKNKDSHALSLLSIILGSGTTSYLYKKLVLEEKIAVSAGSWYMLNAYDDSQFGLYGFPTEGTTLEKLEERIESALKTAYEEAFHEKAIQQAKTRIIAETVYEQDSQQNMAINYGQTLSIGLSFGEIEQWPDIIASVTADEMRSVMERFLLPNRSVTGYLLKS